MAIIVIAIALVGRGSSAACFGDFDSSGDVGFGDLTDLLIHWAPAPNGQEPWDLTDDQTVGFADLTELLLVWGPCPCLSWFPPFSSHQGTSGAVYALATYDDGNGPALYAGGDFTSAGDVAAIDMARWDGLSWSAVSGATDGSVRALTVFDDGHGPALYVGGLFSSAGGSAASNIARWDGASWSALGSGTNGSVFALVVYDDGDGPALHAGGTFTEAGGAAANRVARWDGSSWSALGDGVNGVEPVISALAVFDDGLCAGGLFSSAGGAAAENLAKWDGTAWSALGSGTNGVVYALTVFDDNIGPAPTLFAGGWFTMAGGASANYVARWNGLTWSSLGSGTNGVVQALVVHDPAGPSGPLLHAGGLFTIAGGSAANRVAQWTGATWSAQDGGINGPVHALAAFDDEGTSGSYLFAGGVFSIVSGLDGDNVARWDGADWSTVGRTALNGTALSLVAHNGQAFAPGIYAGGEFTVAGDVAANRVARWDGLSWSPLGTGVNGIVNALTVFDQSGPIGPRLCVGGTFSDAGGVAAADRVALWNGSSWLALGSGINSAVSVYALATDGGNLYAAGAMSSAGGVAVNNIARWDGSSWSALGSGVTPGSVYALAVYDDGSGPALYAGGGFTTAGGVAASRIARWNGSTWSPLGSGMNSNVYSLAVFDDGNGVGAALYAGGNFTAAGGVVCNRIARWDGASWSPLGSGTSNRVRALLVHDDGTAIGAALYAGGAFSHAGGIAVNAVARWNGSAWSALDGGIEQSEVRALASHLDKPGSSVALFAGGTFVATAGENIAEWRCEPAP